MILDLYPTSFRTQMSEVSQSLDHTRTQLTYNAKAVLLRRYQAKDEYGMVTETVTEMFQRVASALSQPELNYSKDELQRNYMYDLYHQNLKALQQVKASLDSYGQVASVI